MLPMMNWNAKTRRRWFGALCLAMAMLMLILGETLLDRHLPGVWFIGYWLVCFLFTTLAICVAMLDARASRREIRQEQKDLLKTTLSGIAEEKLSRGRNNSDENLSHSGTQS